SQSDADLGAQLTRHLSTMKKDKQVLTFLQNHEWLFSDPRFSASAKRQKRIHSPSSACAQQRDAAAKAALVHGQKVRGLAAYWAPTPATVVCRVVGDTCQEAL